MEFSLSCRYELDAALRRDRLWQLFGLVSKNRRRSCLAAVFEDPDAIDLSPAAVGKPASLRSAAFPTAVSITTCVIDLLNIQGAKVAKFDVLKPNLPLSKNV